MNSKLISITLDKIGIGASTICMLHCMLVPLLLVFGADSSLWFVESEWIEHLIIGVSLVVGLISFLSGYRQHTQLFIPVLFIAGFLLLVNGEAVETTWVGVVLSVIGALIIVYAHTENLKWKRMAADKAMTTSENKI